MYTCFLFTIFSLLGEASCIQGQLLYQPRTCTEWKNKRTTITLHSLYLKQEHIWYGVHIKQGPVLQWTKDTFMLMYESKK